MLFRSPYLSRLRLMALDFVLSYPANQYLVTEEEKLAYFAERFQLSPEVYPSATYHSARQENRPTTRYFIEKYPVYEAPGGAAFTYLDENSLASFGTFLDRYQSLLSALPAATLVYVATSARILEAARSCFTERWRKPLAPIDYAALESAFQTRAGLERKPLEELTQADLNALRALRNARLAGLFGDWQAYGMEAIRTRYERNASVPVPAFTPCIVPVEYSFL